MLPSRLNAVTSCPSRSNTRVRMIRLRLRLFSKTNKTRMLRDKHIIVDTQVTSSLYLKQ